MRKNLLFLLFIYILCFFSCNRNSVNTSLMLSAGNDSILVLSIEDKPEYEIISYDNLIEKVRYIPLDTNSQAYVSSFPDVVYVRKIKGNFVVSSLELGAKAAKIFDSEGNYVAEVFRLGRGPEDVMEPKRYTVNDSTGVITYIEFDGNVFCYDMNTMSRKKYHAPRTYEPGELLTQWVAFDNGSYAAAKLYPLDEAYDENVKPYMYYIDKDIKTRGQLYYPEKRKLSQVISSGVTKMPYEQWILSQTCNGPEFIDMYNDTVYSVSPEMVQKPLYVVDRGEKYRPNYIENRKQRQKKNKYYFFGLMDSPQYFIIRYYYDDTRWVSVWNNTTGKRIIDVEIDPNVNYYACSLPFSFDGFTGWLPVEYVTKDNKIYVVGDPRFFEKAPSHNDDKANSVLIEIQLKNNI